MTTCRRSPAWRTTRRARFRSNRGWPGSRLCVALAVFFALCVGSPAEAEGIGQIWQQIRWGEPSSGLVARFGADATILSRPIDFGDSYAQVVLRDVRVGGLPLVAYLQIDKASGGLKRIQLERQRHGVNPPAFRAVVGGLEAEFGAPDAACAIPPAATNGYQAATELAWSRAGNLIRAVFRDTTLEAFEGCPTGDLTAGPCGLTGQLFVRISPSGADRTNCGAAGVAR